MKEYASKVASSIKFFVEGECVERRADQCAKFERFRGWYVESRGVCWPASLGRGILH
jgi:hypothetical protein